ncbi:MAG: carbohydrate binding domain-containing protein [Bacteroidales bacterium]|nr:carbohydrate binding domain-containing protein [Bacteroidales bacterium]
MKKTIVNRASNIAFILTVVAIASLNGCTRMSETIPDRTAGMNGSFEYAKAGLPVNWILYTPNTVPTGDFEINIDTTEYKDGKQSLKFLVRECSATGGWHSPGFCNEFDAESGKTYKVSFWIKNEGSEFFIRIGGVSVSQGQYETVVKSSESTDSWKLYEYNYVMPENIHTIRFEMNILQPGSCWIDDIRIVESTETL